MVGGSTDRQGRVEVCVGGRRWRTVCTGSQELAGAVCLRMGYIFEGIKGPINACIANVITTYLQKALWHYLTHSLLEHSQSTD